MGSQIKSVTFFLLLALLASTIEAIPSNVFLTFVRSPSDTFYLESAHAGPSALNTFNILDRLVEPDQNLVAIQYSVTSSYWGIRAGDSKLVMNATESLFRLEYPSPDDQFHFRITYNGDPLVAYEWDSPISFYLQSKYPKEPPAIFRFVPEGDVDGSYQNLRANIHRTVDSIRAAFPTPADREPAYLRLVSLMAANGHFSGEEVFYVAHLIQADVSNGSPPFRALPEQVQLLASAIDLKWVFRGRLQDRRALMRYVTASDSHDDSSVLPYRFYYVPDNGTWTITYGKVHKLYTLESSGYDLLETTDGPYLYRMRIRLHVDLERFEVLVHIPPFTASSWYYLFSRVGTGGPTNFYGRSTGQFEYFHVEPYPA